MHVFPGAWRSLTLSYCYVNGGYRGLTVAEEAIISGALVPSGGEILELPGFVPLTNFILPPGILVRLIHGE